MKTRKTEYDCEQCDKSFPENWLLKRHMKNSHENKTLQIGNNFGIFAENTGNYDTKDILYCDQCGYQTPKISNFKRHRKSQHEIEKKQVKNKCDFCDYTSDRAYNVKLHEKKCNKFSAKSDRSKYRLINVLKKRFEYKREY